jgi:hypothetical protein
VLSFFTNNIGDENGLELFWIRPAASISCTCFSISSLIVGAKWYDREKIGPAPGIRGMA